MVSRLQFYTQKQEGTMNLLHLDASILGANSASRQVSAAVVHGLKKG